MDRLLGSPRGDPEPHHLGVGQQPVEIGSVLGLGGRIGGAVEGSRGRVEHGELRPRLEIGEVDDQVGALGRREGEAVSRQRGRDPKQTVVSPDLRDPVELRLSAAA